MTTMRKMTRVSLACFAVVAAMAAVGASTFVDADTGFSNSFPMPPFSRDLFLTSPEMSGTDVTIYQNLVKHWHGAAELPVTGTYDAATKAATVAFQQEHGLGVDGIVGPNTAAVILSDYSADGYKDDGVAPEKLGYMYKVHVPVYKNRSVETVATLYSGNNTVMFQFKVRAHGHDTYPAPPNIWPDFNNTNDGLNMFSSDGNTPTGLMEFDLNSPEDAPKLYGPYPVNRAVTGVKGNAAFLVPNIRDGILLHTGEWPGWTAPMIMPNSAGCIHAYPESIKHVWELLVSIGVEVHPNTDGKLPYPYKCQGLLSVEQMD